MRRGRTEECGQAEIHEPDAATRVNQDIFRLDVAVHDPGLVSMLKRFGDLRHVIERPTFGDRPVPLLQKLPEARPLHVFHHQAIEIPCPVHVEHRHDERVTQLRQRTPLAEEPLLKRAVGLQLWPDDLDGHEPVQ